MPSKGTGGSGGGGGGGGGGIIRMSHGDILAMTEPFVNALIVVAQTSPLLNPWPSSCVTTPPELKVSFDRLRETHQAAQTGNHLSIAERNESRLKYNQDLIDVRDFVCLAARKDPSLLVKTQMDLWKVPAATAASPGRSAVLKHLTLKHGSDHGVIIASTAGVAKAKSFELHICEGDPTVEENWKFVATYPGCSKMVVQNLQPGTLYHFRLRAVLPSGYSSWSPPASLMAI